MGAFKSICPQRAPLGKLLLSYTHTLHQFRSQRARKTNTCVYAAAAKRVDGWDLGAAP